MVPSLLMSQSPSGETPEADVLIRCGSANAIWARPLQLTVLPRKLDMRTRVHSA